MLISVITVSLNSAATIQRTFDSVFAQDFADLEYVVIDGGSTDGTLDIIDKNKKKITKTLIEPDEGIYDALNKAIKLSSGDILCVLHSDDVFCDDRSLSEVATFFRENSLLDIIFCDVKMKTHFFAGGFVFHRASWFSKRLLRVGMMPPHPGFFIKREVFDQIGLYSKHYDIAGDFEFLVRLINNGNFNHHCTNFVSTVMEQGGASNSNLKSRFKASTEIVRACKENGIYSNLMLSSLRFPLKILMNIREKVIWQTCRGNKN